MKYGSSVSKRYPTTKTTFFLNGLVQVNETDYVDQKTFCEVRLCIANSYLTAIKKL